MLWLMRTAMCTLVLSWQIVSDPLNVFVDELHPGRKQYKKTGAFHVGGHLEN